MIQYKKTRYKVMKRLEMCTRESAGVGGGYKAKTEAGEAAGNVVVGGRREMNMGIYVFIIKLPNLKS